MANRIEYISTLLNVPIYFYFLDDTGVWRSWQEIGIFVLWEWLLDRGDIFIIGEWTDWWFGVRGIWSKQKLHGLSAQDGRKSTIPYSKRALHLTDTYTWMKWSSSCVRIFAWGFCGFACSDLDFGVFVVYCFMKFSTQHPPFHITLHPNILKNSISLPNHGLLHTLNYNPHYVINTISHRRMHIAKRKSLTNPFSLSPGFPPVLSRKITPATTGDIPHYLNLP